MTDQPINGHGPQQPTQEQIQIPVECMPSPIPAVCLAQVDPRFPEFVDLIVVDAAGQRHIFLPHTYATRLAEQLTQIATASRTGLVIP
jgi:hypothetical protein